MARKSVLYIALLGAFMAPALTGCVVQTRSGEAEQPPPPPPPAEPAPAPEPAPATEPAAEEPAQPEEKPKSDVAVEDGRVKIPGNIVFDTGKATLKQGAGSEEVLQQLLKFLQDNPRVTKLRIEGHTDNVGEEAANLELSGQRALTVKKWLIDKGIEAKRLLAVGFGEGKPIADNATEQGKAQNRRTEFHMAELDGKRYLGRDPKGGGKAFK
jgi:OOP family OmpA-OmpF porin